MLAQGRSGVEARGRCTAETATDPPAASGCALAPPNRESHK